MSQNLDILNTIYDLKPGERATITVEFLNNSCKRGVKAAITSISESDKKSREQYFQIISAQRMGGVTERAIISEGCAPEESI